MTTLASITNEIKSVSERWAALAVANQWKNDSAAECEAFSKALLEVAFAVLTADGPLNAYEHLLLAQLFGLGDAIDDIEGKVKAGGNALSDGLPRLSTAVRAFAEQPGYNAEADPVLNLVSDILDVGLAADKFPSETEAWAASRVLGKLRRAVLETPTDLAASPATTIVSSDPTETTMEPNFFTDAPSFKITTTFLPPGATPAAKPTTDPAADVRSLLMDLHKLVGLDSVKEEVETLINIARVRAMRAARGLPSPDMSLHLIFSGNPGTGKTTVARIIGKIYGALGMLSVGKCIEVDRAALIGEYVGQTTAKTKAILESALGSVLFIDEAYSLTDGEQNVYGEEAISVILKFMEDHRDDFVLIAAGYTGEMATFLDSNPGLRSRFARTIEFPDYDLDQLTEIFSRMCGSDGYLLDVPATSAVRLQLAHLLDNKLANFANAREARKIYERAIGSQANRIASLDCSDQELRSFVADDFTGL